MTELDSIWFKMLDNATSSAGGSDREEVASYLRLRATNDQIRRAGVDWLFSSAIEAAGRAMRDHKAITIERFDPHSFAHGNSRMVGSKIEVRLGVRCLMIEAGWARTPSDGIMRTGALAFARISHFGLPAFGTEIRLIHSDPLPVWSCEDGTVFGSVHLEGQVKLLLDN